MAAGLSLSWNPKPGFCWFLLPVYKFPKTTNRSRKSFLTRVTRFPVCYQCAPCTFPDTHSSPSNGDDIIIILILLVETQQRSSGSCSHASTFSSTCLFSLSPSGGGVASWVGGCVQRSSHASPHPPQRARNLSPPLIFCPSGTLILAFL